MDKDNNDGLLFDFWNKVFLFLGKLSIFNLIRKAMKDKKDKNYEFIDKWVIGNLIASILASIHVYHMGEKFNILFIVVSIYGGLRILEILIYQINVFLFDQARAEAEGKKYKVKSIRRVIIALLHNLVEVIFWYAVIVMTIMRVKYNRDLNASLGAYISESFYCLATYNREAYTGIVGENYRWIYRIINYEVISGLIMTIISITRFIGIMPAVAEHKN